MPARGEIIAATDDDAVVDPEWLDRADAALTDLRCDFVGGPVTPLWHQPPPAWLDLSTPSIQKVLALLDYGAAVREFGVGIGWPLGVNIAYRREAFAKTGLFDPSLGRKAGTLRSQAQREWHLRARAAGCRGFYVPDMRVQHRVDAERLKKDYFRRWHYWHGISRARLYYRYGFGSRGGRRPRATTSRCRLLRRAPPPPSQGADVASQLHLAAASRTRGRRVRVPTVAVLLRRYGAAVPARIANGGRRRAGHRRPCRPPAPRPRKRAAQRMESFGRLDILVVDHQRSAAAPWPTFSEVTGTSTRPRSSDST